MTRRPETAALPVDIQLWCAHRGYSLSRPRQCGSRSLLRRIRRTSRRPARWSHGGAHTAEGDDAADSSIQYHATCCTYLWSGPGPVCHTASVGRRRGAGAATTGGARALESSRTGRLVQRTERKRRRSQCTAGHGRSGHGCMCSLEATGRSGAARLAGVLRGGLALERIHPRAAALLGRRRQLEFIAAARRKHHSG